MELVAFHVAIITHIYLVRKDEIPFTTLKKDTVFLTPSEPERYLRYFPAREGRHLILVISQL